MKIWAKLIIEHKNVKDTIISDDTNLTYTNYDEMLRHVAYNLDIPTPLALKTHYNYLTKFNSHKYKADDFVESINFDWLELEYISED